MGLIQLFAMTISDFGNATKAKSRWLHHVTGVVVTASLFTVGSLVAPRSAQALSAGNINPIVLIDQDPNNNFNQEPQSLSCLTGIDPELSLREGTPNSCPPNFGQGTVFIGTQPNPGAFAFGFTFDVFTPQRVNALGIYNPQESFDPSNTPTPWLDYTFKADHTVSLYRFTGTDYGLQAGDFNFWSSITSAFQPGSPAGIACNGVVKDLFCWLPVGPVDINEGVYMVSSTGGWSQDYFADGGSVIAANPDTGWIESVFSPSSAPGYPVPTSCYTYPASTNCVLNAYPLWAANVSTEVPAPLPLAGAAAGFAWTRRLRRRIALSQPEA
ncbi:hypothetical protein NZK33_19620 [Cyanobium sp. FGCU-6]|nr:hypothetical protein [Cyanobium sp. FGCU6]